MNSFLHGMVRAVAETFELPGPIFEIGSYLVPGQEECGNLRSLFADKPYVGVDIRPGPGVDCVGNVEALPQADSSVGTVIAMNIFEHVQRFWLGFDEIYRVLRPDGALLVSCPFYFYIHNFPNDYWRFTPEAMSLLLERYPQKIIGWQGPKKKPLHVWALAFREECPTISGPQFEQYRKLIAAYCDQPMPRRRRLRYTLGRLLFGRGPFAPYLERNSWESECRISAPTR
ncbi:MAG: methyltransferase domain-containing protein [Gemmataceae bacterium]